VSAERKPPASASGYALPTFSIPDLPTSSGAWFGTRTQILEKDAAFVRAHAEYQLARSEQTDTTFALLNARMRVARLMAELVALPEICRREQEHAVRMLAMKNEIEVAEAAIALAESRGRLAQVLGAAKPKSAADGTVSIDDVESILTQFPELDADNIGRVSMLLRALVREKAHE
jgi:hypothetical protein